jgi:hypothetical protein
MRGPREERIKWLDECAHMIITAERKSVPLREFIAGALVAFVAEGSFDYLSLCRVFDDALPQAILWFGLITALHPNSDVLTTGGCLGRRIVREVYAPKGLFASPTADIAVGELAVLSGGEPVNGRFRTAHQSIISVEISPCVNARYGLPRSARSERGTSDGELTPEQFKELRYLLDTASRLLGRAEETEDRDLFGGKPKRGRNQSRR